MRIIAIAPSSISFEKKHPRNNNNCENRHARMCTKSKTKGEKIPKRSKQSPEQRLEQELENYGRTNKNKCYENYYYASQTHEAKPPSLQENNYLNTTIKAIQEDDPFFIPNSEIYNYLQNIDSKKLENFSVENIKKCLNRKEDKGKEYKEKIKACKASLDVLDKFSPEEIEYIMNNSKSGKARLCDLIEGHVPKIVLDDVEQILKNTLKGSNISKV